MECIQNDLNLVKEWKYNVEKERKRVKRIYNQLLDDKQQFKQDYNDLKYLNNESEEYSSKRSSLKRVKQILDSKIWRKVRGSESSLLRYLSIFLDMPTFDITFRVQYSRSTLA